MMQKTHKKFYATHLSSFIHIKSLSVLKRKKHIVKILCKK